MHARKDLQFPTSDVGRNVKSFDYPLLILDVQPLDFQLLRFNAQLAISEARPLVLNFRLPTSDFPLPPFDGYFRQREGEGAVILVYWQMQGNRNRNGKRIGYIYSTVTGQRSMCYPRVLHPDNILRNAVIPSRLLHRRWVLSFTIVN